MIGVAALNRDGFKATYSNFGSALTVATVGGDDHVPGEDRWAGVADNGVLSVGNSGTTAPVGPSYGNYVGTSFSTPIVAGAVGLMLAVNPALTIPRSSRVWFFRAPARAIHGGRRGRVQQRQPGRCLCTTATCGAGILDVEQALATPATRRATWRPTSARQ